jgi:Holliday junction resolvase RusA-like endonuclease
VDEVLDMNIELKIKPLSTNQAWKGRRFKTDKYKSFENTVLWMLPKFKGEIPELIAIDLHFGFTSKNSDLDNPVKMILDILQKKYGFNDNRIYELNIRKSITKEPFILITIRPLLPL